MDYNATMFTISILIVAGSVSLNRYQWRKAWEAYYKRPHLTFKAPNGKAEEETDHN